MKFWNEIELGKKILEKFDVPLTGPNCVQAKNAASTLMNGSDITLKFDNDKPSVFLPADTYKEILGIKEEKDMAASNPCGDFVTTGDRFYTYPPGTIISNISDNGNVMKRISALEQQLSVATDLIEKSIKSNQAVMDEKNNEVKNLKVKVHKMMEYIAVALKERGPQESHATLKRLWKDFESKSENVGVSPIQELLRKKISKEWQGYGSAGKVLTSQGACEDHVWQHIGVGNGTVTSVNYQDGTGKITNDNSTITFEKGTITVNGGGTGITSFRGSANGTRDSEVLIRDGVFVGKADDKKTNRMICNAGKESNDITESVATGLDNPAPTSRSVCCACQLGFTEQAPRAEQNPEMCAICWDEKNK